MIVTLAGFMMAQSSGSISSALGIALAVFAGQLSIGWTNDLLDLESDRSQSRTNKPLAVGSISAKTVKIATYISLSACILLSLFGPFGFRGGSLHLLAVGAGLSYNFIFKKTLLSPLPYAVAFAALPSAIALSKHHRVPIWLIALGGLFGLAAHFANVVKDMEQDRLAGVYGLPQRLGSKVSLIVAGTFLLVIAIILASLTHLWIPVPVSALVVVLLFVAPPQFSFPLVMALAIADIVIMVSRISL